VRLFNGKVEVRRFIGMKPKSSYTDVIDKEIGKVSGSADAQAKKAGN
jgi:hypothetical protein